GAYALHQVGPDRVGLEAVGAPDEELLVAQQLDPRVVGAPAAGRRLHAVAADLPPGLVVLLQQPLERRPVLVVGHRLAHRRQPRTARVVEAGTDPRTAR